MHTLELHGVYLYHRDKRSLPVRLELKLGDATVNGSVQMVMDAVRKKGNETKLRRSMGAHGRKLPNFYHFATADGV